MPNGIGALLRYVSRWYSVAVLLALWELLSLSGLISHRLMPRLGSIWGALVEGVQSGDLFYHSWFSLGRALWGFGMAVVLGIVLGMIMARSRRFEMLFEPVFSFGYPVPKIALYPIFIFVFGLGSLSKVALIFLECLYPITLNTYYGMHSVGRIHVWAARNMGAKPGQIFWKVLIPSAGPYIFSGLRIALPIALIVVIITEMIGESVGLGYYITFASASFEYEKFFAGLLAIAIWGFVLDRLLIHLRNWLIFWERETVKIG